MRINTKDYSTFEEIFIKRIYDIPLHFTPKTIIDAGGNIGLASLFFKWKYPESEIVALEIEEENFQLLSKNLATYQDIKPLKKGLYSKNGFLKIYNLTKENDSNSFMVEETDVKGPDTIESVTVDAIMKEQGWETLDILKIDIEGAEKEIFSKDISAWLPKVKTIMVEPHDRLIKDCSKTIFNALRPYDFQMFTSTESTLIFTNESLVPIDRKPGL